jgi:hypothetical protein
MKIAVVIAREINLTLHIDVKIDFHPLGCPTGHGVCYENHFLLFSAFFACSAVKSF